MVDREKVRGLDARRFGRGDDLAKKHRPERVGPNVVTRDRIREYVERRHLRVRDRDLGRIGGVGVGVNVSLARARHLIHFGLDGCHVRRQIRRIEFR